MSSGLVLPGTSRRAFLGSGLKLGAMGLAAATVGSALVLGQAKPAAAYDIQEGWRFCSKCHCLFYNPSDGLVGLCAAGGQHAGSLSTSYDYILFYNTTADSSQDGWAYCNRCQSLHYASANGWCPGSGHHRQGVSHNYVLLYNYVETDFLQPGWRYCNKCKNLTYGGFATPLPCAAGGTHYLGGSLDYCLNHY